ncbi:MAG: DUF2693 domain-containing protein [Bacteroidetes bacterium]|nr:DUF2693 domain-containing protein [bacterium]NBP65035.1 DUF2693 domain-containing protein [Bacteroidota bacterium]
MDTTNQEWRDGLKATLATGEATVEFTKANGQHRVMRCTLQEGVVPVYSEKGTERKPPSGEVLVVWDLEKSEWRSFRYNSVTSVRFGA